MAAVDLRVPQIADQEEALRVWYTQPQIGKADCCKIFGCSEHIWWRLKAAAVDKMREKKIPSWNGRMVSTIAAFEAWGIDVERLEKGVQRMRRLGL